MKNFTPLTLQIEQNKFVFFFPFYSKSQNILIEKALQNICVNFESRTSRDVHSQ